MDMASYLMKEYQERMDTLRDAIAAGHCVSYEEYKFACGQIRGLEAACTVIQDLKQHMETSDD